MTGTKQMLQNEAQQQMNRPVDPEAANAIQETRNALEAISQDQREQAIEAIERATGKIDILLATNPANALIPVDQEVAIFDTAPDDVDDIHDIAVAADAAVELGNYPGARALLYGLMSEVRVHTTNLPLGSYPTALSTAARLLEQNKSEEAAAVLETALNTLVLTDHIIPIPMLLARYELEEAQAQREKDKQSAIRFVESAQKDLLRARELGYAISDPDYNTLNDQLSELRKQLKTDEDTSSLFSRIRERLAALLKRQSQREYRQPQAEKQNAAGTEKKAA